MSVMARDTEPDDLDVDCTCRIGLVHGLQLRSDLNGKLARAVRWVPSKSRWALIVDGGEKVLVKADNIDFQAQAALEAEAAAVAAVVAGTRVPTPVVGKAVASSPLEFSPQSKATTLAMDAAMAAYSKAHALSPIPQKPATATATSAWSPLTAGRIHAAARTPPQSHNWLQAVLCGFCLPVAAPAPPALALETTPPRRGEEKAAETAALVDAAGA